MKTRLDTTQKKSPVDFSNTAGNVKVVCRFRPLNQKEIAMGEAFCCEFLDEQTVIIKNKEYEANPDKTKYYFDRVFSMDSEQDKIYEFAAKPVIESVLEGFNGTVFAYGQTSSGKTHTMQGPNIDDPILKGIIPRMVTTVFEAIGNSPDYIEFRLKISLVEIYMERLRDLLDISKNDLKIREDKNRGIYIQDVTVTYVSEEKEIYNAMRIGNSNRAISATQMNEGSSRSHSIFLLTVSQNNLNDMSAKTGKLFLVDLAGSEKIGKTGASGQTLDEAKKINKSLSSLGNVINALTDGKSSHIPYRDSKLTRILQESLGGNARTTLIVTCSPSPYNEAETISALRFGVRAKSIKNKPKINRELTVIELQALLAKAEKTIEEKEIRIKQLEDYLKNLGNNIPEQSNVILEKEEDENKEEDYNTTDVSKLDRNTESPLMENLKNNLEETEVFMERIKALDNELEMERNNVKSQTEKVNALRKEFTLLNAKSLIQEKENEALIRKLAEITISFQSNEELLKEKDDRIEQLDSLRITYINEIEGLKESKEHLLQIIDEKNKELEIRVDTNSLLNESIFMRKSVSTKLEQNTINMELYNELERSLAFEKENALRNYKKYEEIKENYDKLCKDQIPDIEAIKKTLTGIVKEEGKQLIEESVSDELKIKIEELSRKNHELDLEREKNSMLESYLMQTKKILRKKINCFENSIEQITNSYHQLVSQRSVLKVDNQALEKQIARKNERIIQLEKLLFETKEQQNIQKSRYEALKAMVYQSEMGDKIYMANLDIEFPMGKNIQGFVNNPLISSFEEEKNMNILTTITEDTVKSESRGSQSSGSTNKKIVKHIRGGQAKLNATSNQIVNKAFASNHGNNNE